MTDQASSGLGVLETTPPAFTPAQVAGIARELFGVEGTARDLGSERDQTFMIDAGEQGGVLKISNLGEDPASLDIEVGAVLHIAAADPELPVARQIARKGAGSAPDLEDFRPTYEGSDGPHYVRLFERMQGRSMVLGPELDDAALVAYGVTTARLARAMRGFFHPAAGRHLLWDSKHALDLRPLVESIPEPSRRDLIDRVLDRFERDVTPVIPSLRAQVVHNDLSLDNVVLDDRGRITGIVDFGDMAHTSLVCDLTVAMASVLRGRDADDLFRSGRLLVDGYQSVVPLEPLELDLCGTVLLARLATLVTLSAWRVLRYPENAEYIQAWDVDSWAMLEQLDELGFDRLSSELGGSSPAVPDAELAARRRAVLGPAVTPPTYARPVHVARGQGAWLFDPAGGRILDGYNNVPVVGHCHPRVTEAVVRQTRALNTHARYLYEPLVELGERMIATMPPELELNTILLVNSGSEANDVAWRIALAATGNDGGLVTGFAYHGITTVISDMSPEEWIGDYHPDYVEKLGGLNGAETEAAIGRLAQRGHAPAAVYLDTGFTSDGFLDPEPADVAAIAAAVKAAGGLVVADEVQAGHGRAGKHLWSFQDFGLAPDMVSMGKPMGNGYPVAALLVRGDLAEEFARTTEFFSTFGGNPVASAAAVAVLDVIDDYGLVAHADRVGANLRAALREAAAASAEVIAVRGRGMLTGVEISSAERARAIVDGMRERGVLIGVTGPANNVLKIRPPLVFGDEHVEILVAAFADSLSA